MKTIQRNRESQLSQSGWFYLGRTHDRGGNYWNFGIDRHACLQRPCTKRKGPEATATLADNRVRLEQFFQDNRTYVDAVNTGGTKYFTYALSNQSATTYTITATGETRRECQARMGVHNRSEQCQIIHSGGNGWSLLLAT